MRAIPSNIMAGFFGLGYDADHSEVYTSTALDYKCIGYWRFESTSKYQNTDTAFLEVKNSAPYGVDGNLSTINTTHSTANSNISISPGGFIDFGNNYQFEYNNPFSLYIKFTNRDNGEIRYILSNNNRDVDGARGYGVFTFGSRIFFGIAKSSNVNINSNSISTYSTGIERDLVITYDGSKSSTGINIYIDGSSIATTFSLTTNDSTSIDDSQSISGSNLYIGQRPNGITSGDLIASEFGIWDRKISNSNITALYNGGSGTTIKFINHIPDVAYMNHMVVMEVGSGTRYYTNSDIKIIYNDGTGNQTYLSRGLTVPNIEYSASPSIDQMSIEFDNVDLTFSNLVLGEEVRGKTVKIYLANMNKVPQVISRDLLFLGIIESVNVTREKAIFNLLSHMYLWQKKIPKRNHSARCQWTFKDSLTCKYAGSDTVCDKSWDDCASNNKVNTANFGGFRWLPSLIDKQIWWGSVPS